MSLTEYQMKTLEGYHPRIHVTKEFVESNRLILGRSIESILEKIENNEDDFLGHSQEVLVPFLPFDKVQKYLADGYFRKIEAGELEWRQITDAMEATQDFLDYLVFGWRKALDRRGISASRTIEKLSAWMWLLGREDLEAILNNEDYYNPYGMPALIELSISLGIKVPDDCYTFANEKCKEGE